MTVNIGPDPESLEISAQGIAHTVVLMIRGGAPRDVAMQIVSSRSQFFKQLEPRINKLVDAGLADYGIKVKDLVTKPGVASGTSAGLKESFDPEIIENGDLVGFGEKKYYILDINHSPSYFWASSKKADRLNCEAKGFPVYKKYASEIIERSPEDKK